MEAPTIGLTWGGGAPRLTWRPVELPRDARTCVAHRRDAERVSWPCRDPDQTLGPKAERYLEWLARQRMVRPHGYLLGGVEGRPVAQLELSVDDQHPDLGYVNLVYLVPECRGRGLGSVLLRELEIRYAAEGIVRGRLSVAEGNLPAQRAYRSAGWGDLGPRPGKPGLRWFGKRWG